MHEDTVVALIAAGGILAAALPASIIGYMGLKQSKANGVDISTAATHVDTGNGRSLAQYVMDLDVKADRTERKVDRGARLARDHDRRDRNAFASLGVEMEPPASEL